MKFNIKPLLIAISALTVATLFLSLNSLSVAAAPAKSKLNLSYEIQTDRQGNQYGALLAKLTREDGYPLGDRSVAIFETTEVFGTARVSIGSAVTSAVGIATLRYETRLTGLHNFTVVFTGDEQASSVISDFAIEINNLPDMTPLVPPTGMEHISKWTLMGVGVLTLGVWAILIYVVLGTISGIRSHSKEHKDKRFA